MVSGKGATEARVALLAGEEGWWGSVRVDSRRAVCWRAAATSRRSEVLSDSTSNHSSREWVMSRSREGTSSRGARSCAAPEVETKGSGTTDVEPQADVSKELSSGWSARSVAMTQYCKSGL